MFERELSLKPWPLKSYYFMVICVNVVLRLQVECSKH